MDDKTDLNEGGGDLLLKNRKLLFDSILTKTLQKRRGDPLESTKET